jgi:hypothetical protein
VRDPEVAADGVRQAHLQRCSKTYEYQPKIQKMYVKEGFFKIYMENKPVISFE